MRLFFIMRAICESITTVVQWTVPHETVLKGIVPLFMPFEMTYHFFLLDENSRVAVQAVKMFSEMKMTRFQLILGSES